MPFTSLLGGDEVSHLVDEEQKHEFGSIAPTKQLGIDQQREQHTAHAEEYFAQLARA